MGAKQSRYMEESRKLRPQKEEKQELCEIQAEAPLSPSPRARGSLRSHLSLSLLSPIPFPKPLLLPRVDRNHLTNL